MKPYLTLLVTLVGLSSAWGSPTKTFPAPEKPLIQVGVEVVEVDANQMQQLGVTWISSLNIQEESVPSVLKLGALTRTALFTTIEALIQEGAADLLANPKLVTRDGTTASFHAGGELPYATSGSLGTVNVEFKPYGVDLKISPHVNDVGNIVLELDAEVSGIDNQTSITLSGNTVPGILSRRLSSQLTLEPGSTLTLAGLIQNQRQWMRTGVPGLWKIPVLGYLFSHKTIVNKRTSIVVFVTPTILNADHAGTRMDNVPHEEENPAKPMQPGEVKAADYDDFIDDAKL